MAGAPVGRPPGAAGEGGKLVGVAEVVGRLAGQAGSLG